MYGVQHQLASDASVWLLVIWSPPGCLVCHLGSPPVHHLVSQTTNKIICGALHVTPFVFYIIFHTFLVTLGIRILFWNIFQYGRLCLLSGSPPTKTVNETPGKHTSSHAGCEEKERNCESARRLPQLAHHRADQETNDPSKQVGETQG